MINITNFKEMSEYVIKNNDVLQISLTITEIGEDDYHYSIDTISNARPKQKLIEGVGYTIEEAMKEWNRKNQ